MKYKVLITTSGIGQRLGEFTKYTNKSLAHIGDKPAISHIIESYPKNTRFVVTLGHFGNHVKDFLTLAYPKLKVEYVKVPKYEGPGTSLGFSMLQARKVLDCPFIYHASDTLVRGAIPEPGKNWIGVFQGDDTSQYASWTVQDGTLRFQEKGAIDADFIHIGLIGVHDHRQFWKELGKLVKDNPNDQSLNDCRVLVRMIEAGADMKTVAFPVWHDIGNVTALQRARREAGELPGDLDKIGEATFLFDTFVIKFFSDDTVVKNRAERGRILREFVPPVEGVAGNFFRYRFVPGELYSGAVQPKDFRRFLDWVQTKFWKPEHEVSDVRFAGVCREFYRDKTKKRIARFLENNKLPDTTHTINGERIPPLKELLRKIDFSSLAKSGQSRFHGDFILDNILRTKKGFCFLDWRQDFGGLLRSGDRYYDLAKLNHNLTINHQMIKENLFSTRLDGKSVVVDILRPNTLVECQKEYFLFLRENGYDLEKVELLTALIWLNMAPLHQHPLNLFLYYFGKLHLWRVLQKKRSL